VKIGYARVSTQDQNLDRQMDALKNEGCDKIFDEKMTGTKRHRPELEKMLEVIRKGDVIIVTDLTRLSRSTKDLIQLMEHLAEQEVDFKSLKENWIDTTTSIGKFIFTVMAGLSQFERDLTSDRTKEGLAAARARGRVGGRRSKPKEEIQLACELYKTKKHSLSQITKMTGVSKTSLYRYLKKKVNEMYKSGNYSLKEISEKTGVYENVARSYIELDNS